MSDGLERARNANIPTAYREPKLPLLIQWSIYRSLDNLVKYKKPGVDEQLARNEYDRDLAQLVLRDSPDLVVCAGWMHSKQASLCNELCSIFCWSRKQIASNKALRLMLHKHGLESPLSCPTRTRSTQIHHILRYVVLHTLTDWISVLAPSFLDPISEAGVEVINLHPALPGVS